MKSKLNEEYRVPNDVAEICLTGTIIDFNIKTINRKNDNTEIKVVNVQIEVGQAGKSYDIQVSVYNSYIISTFEKYSQIGKRVLVRGHIHFRTFDREGITKSVKDYVIGEQDKLSFFGTTKRSNEEEISVDSFIVEDKEYKVPNDIAEIGLTGTIMDFNTKVINRKTDNSEMKIMNLNLEVGQSGKAYDMQVSVHNTYLISNCEKYPPIGKRVFLRGHIHFRKYDREGESKIKTVKDYVIGDRDKLVFLGSSKRFNDIRAANAPAHSSSSTNTSKSLYNEMDFDLDSLLED